MLSLYLTLSPGMFSVAGGLTGGLTPGLGCSSGPRSCSSEPSVWLGLSPPAPSARPVAGQQPVSPPRQPGSHPHHPHLHQYARNTHHSQSPPRNPLFVLHIEVEAPEVDKY